MICNRLMRMHLQRGYLVMINENTLFLASNNKKKMAEMQRILEPMGIKVVNAQMMGIELPEVDETGETFEENALLKAMSGMQVTGIPSVADDSGLMVDALGGAPGVYSARFAGEHGNDKKNNELLLEKMKNVPEGKRTAHYVSSICCVFPDGSKITARGECYGTIGFECDGNNGFGYDPLFVVNGKAFGRYTPEEKDKISHRGKALRIFAEKIEEII